MLQSCVSCFWDVYVFAFAFIWFDFLYFWLVKYKQSVSSIDCFFFFYFLLVLFEQTSFISELNCQRNKIIVTIFRRVYFEKVKKKCVYTQLIHYTDIVSMYDRSRRNRWNCINNLSICAIETNWCLAFYLKIVQVSRQRWKIMWWKRQLYSQDKITW